MTKGCHQSGINSELVRIHLTIFYYDGRRSPTSDGKRAQVMYVCMYVHMYVCMYLCMYVCRYVCVCIHIDFNFCTLTTHNVVNKFSGFSKV